VFTRARVTSWNYAALDARKGYRAERGAARVIAIKEKKEERKKKRRKKQKPGKKNSRERESPPR